MRKALAVLVLLTLSTSLASGQRKSRSQSWLNGSWEGTGYQIDNNGLWTILLTVKGNRYLIEYPSLKCDGKWRPIRISQSIAIFRETISTGADVCANKGTVVIQRLSRRQIAYRYTNQGEADVTSSSILNRKR